MKLKSLAVIAVLALLTTQNLFAEKLPLETFFKNPQFSGFQVSPNGKELAVLAPINGRMNVAIIDLKTRAPRAITGVTSQDVSGFMWANNDRILFFMDKGRQRVFWHFCGQHGWQHGDEP